MFNFFFQIFSKYEKHRKLLLDDILASMARLPSSKRSLRSYRLNVDEQIQMLTALVLQLVQCMVVLPHNLDNKQECDVNILFIFIEIINFDTCLTYSFCCI